jgi:hypothetical protein
MDRRSLLRGLGLGMGAAAAPTAAIAVGTSEPLKPPAGPEIIKLIETKLLPLTPLNQGCFVTYECPVPTGREVGMGIGGDGHLWVKIDGRWERVLTER